MSKFNLSEIFGNLGRAARKHSPEILTGIGIVGMGTTVVLAVKATPKALMLIEERKREIKLAALKDDETAIVKVDKLTTLETIKTTWKCYIPAAVTGILSTACIVGASSVNARRNAALAAAYTISETALSEYKDKVVETIGEKKEQAVRDAIAKDKIDNDPVTHKDIVITDKGETLCYDALSGRYFKSDIEQIRRSVNNLNERLLFDTYVSLNELYDELGLEEIKIGDDLGWTVNPDSADKGLIELDFSSQLTSDGTPCIVVGFANPPYYDFAH